MVDFVAGTEALGVDTHDTVEGIGYVPEVADDIEDILEADHGSVEKISAFTVVGP